MRERAATTFFACPGDPPNFSPTKREIKAGETVIALDKCGAKHSYGKMRFLTVGGVICVYIPTVNEYFEEL